MEMTCGPRICDREFFTKELDLTIDGMKNIQQAVENGDYKAARHAFSEYIRQSLKPELFFLIPYEKGENDFTLPGESEIDAADRIITHRLVSCGVPYQFGETVDWFLNPTENQYREWTWQLSRHFEFKTLAKAYRETKNEKYAKCFAELFESWVKQAVLPESGNGTQTLCWRTIEAGIRMGSSWPYTLHVFYQSPYFTDDVLVDWYKSVWEHGWRLRNCSTSGNWLIMELNGLAYIGILYPVFRDAPEWKAWAFEQFEKQLDLQLYPDGFQYELSTNYHEVVINNYFRMILLADAYSVKVPEGILTKLENACGLLTKLAMPDGRLPNLNDGVWDPAKKMLSVCMHSYPHRDDFKWFVSDRKQGKEPPFLSVGLPYSGFAVMRSGWGKNAVWGILDAAPFGRGHQHEDKLSMLIYANGRLLVSEGGNYAYDSSEMRGYSLSTRSHNTVRVDGCDQNRRKNYRWEDGEIKKHSGMTFVTNKKYDYAHGEYSEGYGNGISVTHKRSVFFFKEPVHGTEPFFVVVDRLCPETLDEHEYEILWHLEEDSVALEHNDAVTENLKIIVSEVSSMKAEIHIGEKEPQWQGWKIKSMLQGDYSPAPALCYRLRGNAVRAVTVLYPCAKTIPCPIARVIAAENVDDRKITLCMADGTEFKINEPD